MLLALVGNQNCGKTTLFNQLTGSNQHVGNFPGVTIEHKIGQIIGWKNYDLVDLPGIYSIRPYSGEEKVSRDFIIERKPDAIINIVDATNIERNLYLTLQLIEMGKPMVLTNKYLAIPTFIAIMGFIFWMTFSVLGKWLSDLLALGINEVTALVDNALTAYGLNPVVHSLVIDGVFAGVGSMLSFLPIIVVLFFFLAILEDTGYMSRVAFVMDKLLRRIGLSGRSFVPMLIGFGCSVPAIMATRTLSSERDRKMTMLLIPFMSCSAKIPIYAVFTAAFFPDHRGLVMTCLYVFGMLVGIIAAKVLSKTAFTGKPVPFVMELPNYRMPSLKSVLLLMWEKAWDFIRRAFTVIFAATIVIWFLQHFDVRLNVVGEGSTDSLLAIIGTWIAPVFAPLGFGDWRVATALLTGLMAKEAVISTLGVLMNVGANLGSAALGGLFTLPSAVSFLVFCLLYTPCVAALAALRRELGSGVKTVLVMISQCCVAWLAAFCVYALIGVIF